MLTLGTGISVRPEADPLEDIRWADREPRVAGAWMLDHLQGWAPRGAQETDPHLLLEPFSVLAAGAAATSRVPLGVAVTDPVRRSPVALAHTAATTSWLGGRKMVLGLGVGDPGQLRPFGLHPGRERTGRLDYIRPALRDLAALRDKGRLSPEGPDLPLAGVSPFEVYVAAHGPQMLRLTARYGDGWLPTSLPVRQYRSNLAAIREAAAAAGRDSAAVRPCLFLWAALGSDDADSAKLLQRPEVRAVALYRGRSAFAEHGADYPLPHAYVPHEIPAEQAPEVLASIPDALVREAVLHGSPQHVAEKLGEYAEAGCQHVIVQDIGRFADPEGTERSRAALLAVADALGGQ
ncbi:LLM class flavin-dependent oxidoreductase [Amycolatopsis circi]|uniref:LLM class flavin-dependent oxidoreductase n=1 Tax=Amycolatopsis circi TaxID=871959 RepID=UPI000E28427E|nr:LLM class flavin-dependent oxidoreductase [Amycolatopsis circi]